jgi:predicted ferric reductase
MKPIRIAWVAVILLLTALWLLAEPPLAQPYQFIAVRNALLNYAGIMAIGVMSVALMLAARPVVLEPALGGLDKMYRLHKWLGITALVMAIVHWVSTQAPGWLVGLGWLQRSARPRSLPPVDPLLRFVQSQRGLAESMGEWAFYAAVVLIALALIKRFPYRYFFSTHRLLALAYLVLVFHSLMLMPIAYWRHLLGPLMAACMAGGSVAALALLFRLVGRSRQAYGTVERVGYHPEMKVLEVSLQLKSRWAGHGAGQFVFVRFGDDAEPHPFTLSSAWQCDGKLLLLIKELGDYTASLPRHLRAGDSVRVEGPYGQFNFKGAGKPAGQIWIGGGIGITPFIARMKHLALQPSPEHVDLIHVIAALDDQAATNLEHDAQAAHVKLHVMLDARDGLLTGERLRAMVP